MERYYKNKYIKNTISKTDDIEFQIIEWHTQDEFDSNDDVSENSSSSSLEKCLDRYTMRCFGVTTEGISITCC